MCPSSWTDPSPPSPSHPSGCPSALALSVLFHASNLDWWSISHMVIYMFQYYSLKLSHPRLLPKSPKICSLYLCLFCCLEYRVIITIFLNSTHMHKKIIIMVDGRSSNNGDRKTWRNEVCTLGSLKDETGDQTQHPGLPDWKQPRKQCFHLLKWGKRTRGLFIFFCHSCFCCCLGGRGKYGLDRLWLY